MAFAAIPSAVLWGGILSVAGCVTAPATYELCNEAGNEPGCGDAVEVVIVNED